MRKNIHDFIRDFVCENEGFMLKESTKVLELGSLIVEGQEHLSIRDWFNGYNYTGVDFREGNGVDVVANIEDLSMYNDESFDLIICCDTAEHVLNPIKAVAEMKRLVKKYGAIVITSVMNFPIHDYPHDYWRFTPQCFYELLKGEGRTEIQFAGDKKNPHTVVGVYVNHPGICWHIPKLRQDTRYERFIRRYTSPFIQDKINFIRRKARI